MIYTIMGSHVRRNESASRWKRNGIAFSFAAIVSGLAAGALLGFLGAQIASSDRAWIALALALFAIVLGALEFARREPRLIQRNCETPQSILKSGALRAAMRNGSILGVGATSRLGFWLWYIVPLGSLLSGSPFVGAGVYGAYAAARGLAPWLLVAAMRLVARRTPMRFEGGSVWLLEQNAVAHRLAAVQLAVVGAVAVAAFGPWFG